MPRSKNRHTRRKQKRRQRERRMSPARRLEHSSKVSGEMGIRMCGRKRRYQSEMAAIRGGMHKYGIVMRAYLCPICHGWHVTSKE